MADAAGRTVRPALRVGDDDQSSIAGAARGIENLNQFRRDYPQAVLYSWNRITLDGNILKVAMR